MDAKNIAPGTVIRDRYRVGRLIGRGGMGAVYVVTHTKTGAEYAFKILTDFTRLEESHAERFRREARTSARVVSDNVVRIIDADTAPELDNAPFIVMELLKGRDLGAVLLEKKKLPPDEAITILKQVATALDKAHQVGIIHRDLKPENIFLHETETGQTVVKLVDFGISKMVSARNDGDDPITRSNVIMGTPIYMAPEQASGHQESIGSWTDTFALGLIAFHMLTGEMYWQGGAIAQILVQLMMGERSVPSERFPELGPAFDEWFAKACSHHPQERFSRASQMIAVLAIALSREEGLVFESAVGSSQRPSAPKLVPADQAVPFKPAPLTQGVLGGGGEEPLFIPPYAQTASLPSLSEELTRVDELPKATEERPSALSLLSLSMGRGSTVPPRTSGTTMLVVAGVALLLLLGVGSLSALSIMRYRSHAAARAAVLPEPPKATPAAVSAVPAASSLAPPAPETSASAPADATSASVSAAETSSAASTSSARPARPRGKGKAPKK